LAQARSRHRTHRVGHATINLDPDNHFLAVDTSRIVDTYSLAAQRGHASAKNLPGTHVAVESLAFG
jgi:hypothetical protein